MKTRSDTTTSVRYTLLSLLLLVSLALAGCAQSTGQQPGPTSTPLPASQTPVPPTDTPASPTATPDPLSACPLPSGDTALYINREDGYCLLYPSFFSAQIDMEQPGKALLLLGKPQEAGPKMQEVLTPRLSIALNGPPEGMDSRAYAEKWIGLFAQGAEVEQQDATIAGQPAVVANGLPGFVPQRSAFVVTPDGRYTITIFPQPELVPDLADQASQVWETVTNSIIFFKPQGDHPYITPDQACPAETSEQPLYTNIGDGYCLLYPADFALDPEFPGRIVGGPVLGNVEGFGDVRTSLTMGTFGYYPDQTPLQVLQPRMDVIDTTSVQETSLAGNPAVIFRDPRGPWASKQAMIVVNGSVYTIVAQPFEPEGYPQGIEYLDRVWNTVTSSLAFFTPWR